MAHWKREAGSGNVRHQGGQDKTGLVVITQARKVMYCQPCRAVADHYYDHHHYHHHHGPSVPAGLGGWVLDHDSLGPECPGPKLTWLNSPAHPPTRPGPTAAAATSILAKIIANGAWFSSMSGLRLCVICTDHIWHEVFNTSQPASQPVARPHGFTSTRAPGGCSDGRT